MNSKKIDLQKNFDENELLTQVSNKSTNQHNIIANCQGLNICRSNQSLDHYIEGDDRQDSH